ncbi:MAG: PEPxxWA-CTERM sorting domain-containing protein [Patescibacteria group bacterium]
MKFNSLIGVAFVASLAFGGVASAQNNDFDDAGDTAGWTTDRYEPPTFVSGVSGGGRNGVLAVGTDETAGSNDRGPSFSGAFYNTQGRQTTLDPGQISASIELYTPDSAWTNATDDRFGGFWGSTDTGAFPILEFARVAGVDQWRAWDNGTWINTGATVNYDTWATLEFTLLSSIDKIKYQVDGGSTTLVSAFGSTAIAKLYTQVHNTNPDGLVRTANFDNLSTGAVPEPATWALMILGFGSAGAMLRRRRLAVA